MLRCRVAYVCVYVRVRACTCVRVCCAPVPCCDAVCGCLCDAVLRFRFLCCSSCFASSPSVFSSSLLCCLLLCDSVFCCCFGFSAVVFVPCCSSPSVVFFVVQVSIYRVRLRLEFVTDEQKLCLDWDPGETEQNAQCSRIGKTNACHAVLDFWIRTAFGLIT